MKSISEKYNNALRRYLILVVCIMMPCFFNIVSSETFNPQIFNFSLINSFPQCMITNCLQCEQNMPYTCKICQQGKSCCSQNCKTCSTINPTICFECDQNFTYNQSSKSCALQNSYRQKYCTQCKDNIQQCEMCYSGYFLNPFTLTCSSCPQSCLLCNITLYCSFCDQHTFWQNGTCLQCDPNCKTCQNSQTNCTSCEPQRYWINFTCLDCLEHCAECTGPDQCTACEAYHYFDNKTKTCELCGQYCLVCKSLKECVQCSENYYLNETTGFCYSCDEYIPGCQYCGRVPNFYVISQENSRNEKNRNFITIQNLTTNVRCIQCLAGYLLINYTQCKPCIEHCTVCQNLQQCVQCDKFYVYDPSKQKCITCSISNCFVCLTSSECSVCAQGFFWNNISHPDYPFCDRCRVGCKSCGINYCTVCDQGYFFVNETKTCMKCNAECTQCMYKPDFCSACQSGFYVMSNTMKCIKCESNCLRCLSKYSCSECAVGYRNFNKTCVKCTIQNCGYCAIDTDLKETCLQCLQTYFLKNNSCSPCIEGCQTCINDSKCGSCIQGFYLDSPTSTCKKCSDNCLDCVADSSWHINCVQCPPKFYVDQSNHCKPCQIQNCENCIGNQCFRCVKGFYIDYIDVNRNDCKKCQQNCTACLDIENCIECKVGFYLKNYTCEKCSQGCEICNQNGSCVLCSQSYRFNQTSETCQACKTLNCASCSENVNSCNQCLSGFTLENVTQLNEEQNTTNSTSLCFKCGQNSLQGCKACFSSRSCLQCIQGYKMNENNLCEPESYRIWPYFLVICLLSAIILGFGGKIFDNLGIKLKKKLNGKGLSEILKIGKKSTDVQNYHKLEELTIN